MDGVERIPGWRPDPAGHADLRWWDGHRWTDATWSPQGSGVDPVIAGPDATERAHLDYLRRYLLGASARGVISQAAADRLDADVVVWRRVPELPAPSTGPVPAAAPQPVGVAAPALAVAPLPPGAPVPNGPGVLNSGPRTADGTVWPR